MSEETIRLIQEIDGTMKLEGMPLTDEDKEILRKCFEGESTFEIERQKVLDEVKLLYGQL